MRTLPKILALATGILVTSASVLADMTAETWGNLSDGREVRLFTLTNQAGTRVQISNYGALLVSVETKDREGKLANITLSYDGLKEALAGGVYGSVVGRFANRISDGFTIDGTRYDLPSANPKTLVTIHGGKTGFQRQLWTTTATQDKEATSVEFQLSSPDGHEGFPGTVNVSATYTLTESNELIIAYKGETDKPTHLNLTNHAYFNLAGRGDVLKHELQMQASGVLELDDRKVPTGKILPVANTAFDFRTRKPIGRDIESIETGGYDHCFKIISPPTRGRISSLVWLTRIRVEPWMSTPPNREFRSTPPTTSRGIPSHTGAVSASKLSTIPMPPTSPVSTPAYCGQVRYTDTLPSSFSGSNTRQ